MPCVGVASGLDVNTCGAVVDVQIQSVYAVSVDACCVVGLIVPCIAVASGNVSCRAWHDCQVQRDCAIAVISVGIYMSDRI